MIKVVADFRTLMILAHELGRARLSKNEELIKIAQKAHDDYKKICLAADELRLGITYGDFK